MNMKIIKNILMAAVLIVGAVACNEGIDPITYVDPGPDQSAPVVNVISPTEGLVIDVDLPLSSVKIQVEVTDDIELGSVEFLIDGVKITGFTEFRDYRRFLNEYMYNAVTLGNHVLSVKATDLEGKVTTKTVNFSRPPYTPRYNGEVFYMPFNGTYMEKVSFTEATVVGTPGFTTEQNALKGSGAYAGATASYLTFPTTGLKGNEFSATFWYKVNGAPDRSGIINASPLGEDRTKGFRLFREGGAAMQRIKLNVGTGAGETWNDGQEIAATNAEWVHIAFTISGTSAIIYINGAVAREATLAGNIDWTGCDVFGIGSGAPNFTYWGHSFDLSCYDELRMFNKALSQAEIETIMNNDFSYIPKYTGEVFYMPFEGTYKDLITKTMATAVGSPAFAAGKKGQAYSGAADSYITFPTASIKGTSFSAVFWYKVNAPDPFRAGMIQSSVPGEDRTKGFRIFREGTAASQQIKLNVGIGTGEVWNDGGNIVAPAVGWTHVAVTVSGTTCKIYFDGTLARESAMAANINWTGCDVMSIGSGAPNFTYWSHGADLSQYDELRLFNIALTQAQIQTIIDDEN
jgi:hypothetical protein